MARILSIETALDTCSVALHESGKLLHTLYIHTPRSHAAQLAPLIRQLCAEAGCPISSLNAIAVSAGPGSYTGLRIGVSTAKGLCFGLGIPLIAVNTLDIIAHRARQQCGIPAWICPVIDARRMDVFYKIIDPNGREEVPDTAATLSESLFQPYFDRNQTICFAGNGAEKCRTVVRHQLARFMSEILPTAPALGELAFGSWQAGQCQNAATFEPHYTKEFFTTLLR